MIKKIELFFFGFIYGFLFFLIFNSWPYMEDELKVTVADRIQNNFFRIILDIFLSWEIAACFIGGVISCLLFAKYRQKPGEIAISGVIVFITYGALAIGSFSFGLGLIASFGASSLFTFSFIVPMIIMIIALSLLGESIKLVKD